tara:strand:+ start:384 stop:524 length:141 start_codon:yes stop_codon:yes gene_type:complete
MGNRRRRDKVKRWHFDVIMFIAFLLAAVCLIVIAFCIVVGTLIAFF